MMRRLRNFVRLPAARRRLLVETLGLLAAVRLALWTLPYPSVRALTDRLARRARPTADAPRQMVALVAWAVERSSQFVPRSSCLVQALVARVLLARAGYTSRLNLGVAFGSRGEFEAHAWLDSGSWTVVGGQTARRYKPLPLPEELSR